MKVFHPTSAREEVLKRLRLVMSMHKAGYGDSVIKQRCHMSVQTAVKTASSEGLAWTGKPIRTRERRPRA